MTRNIPLTVLYVVSLWDCFTTFFGTFYVLSGKNSGLNPGFFQSIAENANAALVAAMFAGLILVILLLTARVLALNGPAGPYFKLLWGTVLLYDLWTSYLGNSYLVIQGSSTLQQQAVLLGATLLVCACPICISILSTQPQTSHI
jgi:hypothetical protein